MIRNFTLLLAALFIACTPSFAQLCGFDYLHRQLLASDAGYRQRVADDKAMWANTMQHTPSSLVTISGTDTTYEIPVVIHVMNTGGAIGSSYNPTDAQLISMIAYLNQSYAATWAAYPSVLTGGTNVPIRFVLAKRDPNCAATTGILRYNLSSNAAYVANGVNSRNTTGISDVSLKNYERWPVNDYYNVWVVNKIDGRDGITGSGTFTAGYAYYPTAGPQFDGTVMLASQSVAGQITLPHEIGHAMNVAHVFEGNDPGNTGANTCPANANCAVDGDGICDTEPQMQSIFNCPSGINPCTGVAWQNGQHNFMDYSSCQDRFTPGQRTRMITALKQYRSGLLSSLGGIAPATTAVTAACIPTTTTPANTLNAGPRKIVLNDMSATTAGGYNDDGNLVYLDRTCAQQANLDAGQIYPISVTTGNTAEKVRVYIDYDNNGTFSAGELVFSHDATTNNALHTGSFTVPTTGIVTCVPLRMRVVSDRATAALTPSACGPLSSGQAEDYSVMIKGPSNSATIAIALTGGTNPSCINSPLTFTATPSGSVTGAAYKWYLNGVAITGATATTFNSTTLATNSIITARIFYTGPCGPDSSLSNSITVNRLTSILPVATIALTSGNNPGCQGQTLTFTATPVNGGTAPSYTWQSSPNGTTWTNLATSTSNTYTSTTIPCAYQVRAVMTSTLSCASPASVNANVIVYNCGTGTPATAVITQTGGSNPTCAGQPVTFTAAVTNPGTAPVFSWLLNNVPTGASGTTFTISSLTTGDSVQMRFISNNPCVAQPDVLSNKIGITVIPLDSPKATITITRGSNPGCADSLVEFTAIATSNSGIANYYWYVNGVQVATGNVYQNSGLANGDRIFVKALAGPGCHVYDTATSAPIVITSYAPAGIPFISFIGNLLVSDISPVQWYGPNGLIPGATSSSYHPAGPGNYYARAVNNGCPSLPSNVLQVSLLTIGNYNLSQVQIYPNPTSGQLILDWGAKAVNAQISLFTPTGQMVLREGVSNTSRKMLDLSSYASGIYFIVLQDEQGKTGTVRITLNK